jgi:hypothetical protein
MSRRLLLIGAALLAASPTIVPAQPAPPAQAAESGVRNPVAFVRERFARYARGDSPAPWPEYAYSQRLRRLFETLDAAEGGEERINFDWWVDAPDWQVDHVRLRPAWPARGRLNVDARWRVFGEERSGTFLFVRENGRWYLDDVASHTTGWTLSILLEQAARG